MSEDPFRVPMKVDTRDYAGEAKRRRAVVKILLGTLSFVAGAAVFVVGLEVGRIYFFAPIIAVLGAGSIGAGIVDIVTSRPS